MRKRDDELIYSPSDLITFLSDPFSSWMDRRFLENPAGLTPDIDDESSMLIRKKGLQHEEDFLHQLQAESKDICILDGRDEAGFQSTLEAMKDGREIIYQAYLRRDQFAGLSDFLVRANGNSIFGNYHYEVWDTKLARKPKPYFLIQLCCYAEMLEEIQGRIPESVAIVLGKKDRKDFRTSDYYYYYQTIKAQFLSFQNSFDPDREPEWAEVGQYSRWKGMAEQLLVKRDSLNLIAGIRKSQANKLQDAGIETLSDLARADVDSIGAMSAATFERLQMQAKLQFESRDKAVPLYQIIDNEIEQTEIRGLKRLPPPSTADVFFDMEGYPHIEGGLEYLFGVCIKEQEQNIYKDWWAHSLQEEKTAFEAFIDWVFARWQDDSTMHIFHYGAYEVSALRRLASRHATREEALDILLRAGIFIDLYSIIRQCMQIGCDSYSIKKVEQLYMSKREGDVSKATDSIVYYEKWLEDPDAQRWPDSKLLDEIRHYNLIDCESTALLYNWLLERQKEHHLAYSKIEENKERRLQKPKTAKEELAEEILSQIHRSQLQSKEKEEIACDNHETSTLDNKAQRNARILELFAYLLNFHARESKVVWWEIFDKISQPEEELVTDASVICSIRRSNQAPHPHKKTLLYEYNFDPEQDVKIQVGDSVIFAQDLRCEARVHAIDVDTGRLTLRRPAHKDAPYENGNILLKEVVPYDTLESSIERQALDYLRDGTLKPCLHAYLERKLPKIKGIPEGAALIQTNEQDALKWQTVAGIIENMEQSYLCIQGPPGTGKTYFGAHSILHLLKNGKRVGISSNSHKAIENILEAIDKLASEQDYKFKGLKIGKDKSLNPLSFSDSIKVVQDLKADDSPLNYQLIAATAWFFARETVVDSMDYLFVDEAGQVCLANVVAMASATENLVLLGDQLQLDQPVKGAHPGESGLSSLEYLLGTSPTIAAEQGIFLSHTRRMHPLLCEIVSSSVYEDRLKSAAETAGRSIVLAPESKFAIPAGLKFIPCIHEGNSQSSIEEVDLILEIVRDLQKCDISDESGVRPLSLSDIIIVAPYNQQVRLIRQALPSAEVGSVDKFQGRQAAVAIISMASSDLKNSPRGLDFLMSKKRLNVAISRAKMLAIVVGNPKLSQYVCSTVEQTALLNMFCRMMIDGSPSIKESELCPIK